MKNLLKETIYPLMERIDKMEHNMVYYPQAILENRILSFPIMEDVVAKYRNRVCVGYSSDGKPIVRQVGGNTELELADNIAKAILSSERRSEFLREETPKVQYIEAEVPKAKMPTFKTYANQWFVTYKKSNVKRTTACAYELSIRHLCEWFGEMPLDAITTAEIQMFLNANADRAKQHLNELLRMMRTILASALEDALIRSNPAVSKRLTNPSTKVKERLPLDEESMADIIRHMDALQDNDRRYIALLLYTGMRRGEVLGLRWENINVADMTVQVVNNVTFPNGENNPLLTTPKTEKSKRIIPIDAALLEKLKPLGDTGFILGGDKPITKAAMRRMMERIGRTIDLHGATAHVFRHSFATLLADTGAQPKTIQTILGHADISTTMNRYVHANPELAKNAVKNATQAIVFKA